MLFSAGNVKKKRFHSFHRSDRHNPGFPRITIKHFNVIIINLAKDLHFLDCKFKATMNSALVPTLVLEIRFVYLFKVIIESGMNLSISVFCSFQCYCSTIGTVKTVKTFSQISHFRCVYNRRTAMTSGGLWINQRQLVRLHRQPCNLRTVIFLATILTKHELTVFRHFAVFNRLRETLNFSAHDSNRKFKS